MIPLLLGTQAFVTNNSNVHKSEKQYTIQIGRKGKSLDAELQLFTSGAFARAALRHGAERHPRAVKMSVCRGGRRGLRPLGSRQRQQHVSRRRWKVFPRDILRRSTRKATKPALFRRVPFPQPPTSSAALSSVRDFLFSAGPKYAAEPLYG